MTPANVTDHHGMKVPYRFHTFLRYAGQVITHVFLVSMAAHRDQHTHVLAVALIVGLYTWQTNNNTNQLVDSKQMVQ